MTTEVREIKTIRFTPQTDKITVLGDLSRGSGTVTVSPGMIAAASNAAAMADYLA